VFATLASDPELLWVRVRDGRCKSGESDGAGEDRALREGGRSRDVFSWPKKCQLS
jgi:hypothetical protein